MTAVILNSGIEMPVVPQATECERAAEHAIGTGYRLIDKAAARMNEKAVGDALKKGGVNRIDL